MNASRPLHTLFLLPRTHFHLPVLSSPRMASQPPPCALLELFTPWGSYLFPTTEGGVICATPPKGAAVCVPDSWCWNIGVHLGREVSQWSRPAASSRRHHHGGAGDLCGWGQGAVLDKDLQTPLPDRLPCCCVPLAVTAT